MKNSTVLKESVFAAFLIAAMLFFASVVVVSYAGASSIVYKPAQDDRANSALDDFAVSAKLVITSAEDLNHLKKVAQAIHNYRKAIYKSGKATSSVMAVYWKIEAADSLGAKTQAHYAAIKHLLNMHGDELKTLAIPKNISALADKAEAKRELKEPLINLGEIL